MTASTLTSDNGASSGKSGIEYNGGTDGTLQIQTTTSGGTATTAVTIDNSQNVGIGTTTPAQKLQVAGIIAASKSSAGSALIVQSNSGGGGQGGQIQLQNTYGSATNPNKYLRVDDVGNLGIVNSAYTSQIAWFSDTGSVYSNGSFNTVGAASTPTIDVTSIQTTYASGGTQDFSSMSGFIIANSYTTGYVTIFLCGGGAANPVANANGSYQCGTMGYNSGVNGYRWTNNSGANNTISFFVVRTRTGA